MDFLLFAANHVNTLLEKLWQQIYLVAISVCLAIIIGVLLGIIATRFNKLKASITGTANVFQTIPSIALLGFLLPFVGIGATPAIIALTLYALLPIVRNTIIGIESIPKESIEAARALGFTYKQRLKLIELPLALPVIITGIRMATVISVGIATIAAFIGAGGLGDFIYQGLSLDSNNFILLGAIPAALLALLLDYGIGYIERRISWQTNKTHKKSHAVKYVFAAIAIIFLASIISAFWPSKRSNTVVVASKNFTEQFILGNMIADMLEAHTKLHVVKKLDLGSTAICQAAMLKGDIDIYPEYTGSGYLLVLKDQYNPSISKEALYEKVKAQYEKRFHLIWLSPFGFNNTQAMIVREDFAKQHGLQTISDLHKVKTLIIGAAPAFVKRPDGLVGLTKVYNLHFTEIKSLQPDLMYGAIKNKDVNLISAYSTDGRIAAYHLKMLVDNKHLYPPYYAAPVIRESVLKAHPEIAAALKPLAGAINNKTMQQMNYDVNVKGMAPAAVAKDFLKQHHLL